MTWLNCTALFSQKDSIFDQGEYRNYIVHLPKNYKPSTRYPLILNLHGLNSNASQLIWAFFKRYSSSSVATAVADPKKMERIQVFPNPAQEQINVRFPERGLGVTAELLLYNSYGQMVFKQEIESTPDLLSIRASGFSKGVYFLYVKTEHHQLYHQKIVVGLK